MQKKVFKNILIILSLVLVFMPFWMTFGDLLTRFVINLNLYTFIREHVVPWEIRMTAVVLMPFGLKPVIYGEYLMLGGNIKPLLVDLAWNCIGWQSLIFFIVTLFIGLQGDKYDKFSKVKSVILGLMGTFLLNILRIAGITLIAYYWGERVAIVFHDYGSTIIVILWLMFFWWFSYSFVLETKEVNIGE